MNYFIAIILLFFSSLASAANHIIIVDAGSTGSRVHVFSYRFEDNFIRLKNIFHGDIHSGLSSYRYKIENTGSKMIPVLSQAAIAITQDNGDPSQTPIHVFATAGMRILPKEAQEKIFNQLKTTLKQTPFEIGRIETISGLEESIYDWIAVNDMNNSLNERSVGVLDMGGASTQVAFVTYDAPNIVLTLANRRFPLFAHSFLGLGLNESRQHLNDSTIEQYCYPKGYHYTNQGIEKTGEFNQPTCRELNETLIYEHQVKNTLPNTQGMKFIAFSGYYYTHEFFAKHAHTSFQTAVNDICTMNWDRMQKSYPQEKTKYLANFCLQGTYILSLLGEQVGYRIQQKQISYQNTIKSQSINWVRGAAMYALIGDGLP